MVLLLVTASSWRRKMFVNVEDIVMVEIMSVWYDFR